jgi:long-chain fatty acid transport protein
MTTPFCRTRIAVAVAGVALALAGGQAAGTGFQLNEQSASSLGNAFAGGAAFADDVTGMWWNPAVLSQFTRGQVAGALHVVTPSIKFQNDGSLPPPTNSSAAKAVTPVTRTSCRMHVAVPINQQFAFGSSTPCSA